MPLQPEVSICMSDKLKALAFDLNGTYLAGESLSERNPRVVAAADEKGISHRRAQPHVGCNRVLLKSYIVSAMGAAALPVPAKLPRIAPV